MNNRPNEILILPWLGSSHPPFEHMEQREQLFLAPEFLLLLISLPQSLTDPYDSFSWPQDFLEEGRFLSISFQKQLHSLSKPWVGSLCLPSLSGGILSHAKVIFVTRLAVMVFNNKTGCQDGVPVRVS